MKRLFCVLMSICIMFGMLALPTTAESKDPFDMSPSDFVQQIGAGWNLGKTLENHDEDYETVYDQETAFVKTETSPEMIGLVANSGFNAVRIYVSWGTQTKKVDGKYIVNTELLDRIKTIASWCFEYNMFVIVNTSGDDREWLDISADDNEWEEVKKQYRQTWEQVATCFRNYDEKLIFEGGNEFVAFRDFDGCGTSTTDYCWWGCSQKTFDRQNELYQIFVDTVRATGGNNDRRFLILPTYGAQWYEHQIEKLKIPNDDEHIIVDIHWYNYYDQMKPNIVNQYASMWQRHSQERGFGVIIGECGFDENVSSTTKVAWADSFVSTLRGVYKIPVFLWDDGGNMKIMYRGPNIKPAWTENSVDYVKAVIANSRKYIVNPDGSAPVTCVLGDANNNNAFDMMDVLYIRKYLAGNLKDISQGADANRDGIVSVADLLKMRRVLAKLDNFVYN